MAASDHLRGEQLAMFMPAKQLMSRIADSGDRHLDETINEMWDRKLRESKIPAGMKYPRELDSGLGFRDMTDHGTGIHASLSEEGYDFSKPITVFHEDSPNGNLGIRDGHHRLAAAADLDLEVPLQHVIRPKRPTRENPLQGKRVIPFEQFSPRVRRSYGRKLKAVPMSATGTKGKW